MIKFFLKSKTIQGLLITLLGIVFRASGVDVTDGTLTVIQTEFVNNLYPVIMQLIGLLYAAYGRVKASGGITFKGGKK